MLQTKCNHDLLTALLGKDGVRARIAAAPPKLYFWTGSVGTARILEHRLVILLDNGRWIRTSELGRMYCWNGNIIICTAHSTYELQPVS